ncbi:hypothetical protein JCM16106_12730 [Hydrogenophilus islandicus]
MQLVSVVLRVLPHQIEPTIDEAQRFGNVEIGLVDHDKGIIVALVSDEEGGEPLADTLVQLQLLPTVQACSVAYEFFEPTQATSGENHG